MRNIPSTPSVQFGFGIEDIGAKPLLLASISNNVGQKMNMPSLNFPKLSLELPSVMMNRQRRWQADVERGKSTSPGMLAPPDFSLAGKHVRHVIALVGGVIVAGISSAAQKASSLHTNKARVNLPFHKSFSFPWDQQHKMGVNSRESEALARTLMERGCAYERDLDVRAAVQCFEEAVRLSPCNLVTLCMAAKQWSDLTFYYDVRSDRERQLVNLKALEYAERAISCHPSDAGGYLGACISKGRLALFCDNRTKVKLAKEAREAAATALQLGPDNDLAHHLMGRWHYEMSKLNVVVRTVVRIMYGTSLQPGTREDALEAYRQAATLAPHRLVHHVEAGRVAMELGHISDARNAFETALQCDVEDINAWHTRMDAEMLLAQLDQRPWKQPSLIPPTVRKGTPASLSTATLLGLESSELPSPSGIFRF